MTDAPCSIPAGAGTLVISPGVPQTHSPRMHGVSMRLLRPPTYFDVTDREVEEVASIVPNFYRTRDAQRCTAHDI